jgi:hypothetical protein
VLASNTFKIKRYNGKNYEVTLPGDDATEADASAYLDNKYGAKPVEEMSAMERLRMLPDKRSLLQTFTAGSSRSLARRISTVTNVIPAMLDNALGRTDLAQKSLLNAQYAEARIQRQNAPTFPPGRVDGWEDLLAFVAETLGEWVNRPGFGGGSNS